MFTLFIIIGSLTFLSAGYRFATDFLLRKQILSGRATAAELVASLHMESGDELDALMEQEPSMFTRVLGHMGREEFSFSPRRVRKYRRDNLQARIQSIPVHLSVLTLLVIAMIANHKSVVGWLALLAALFIELLRWALPQALERSRRLGGLAMTASVDTEKPSTESIEAEPSEARDANTAEIAVTTATAPVDDDEQGPGSATPTNGQTSSSELPSEEKGTDPKPDEPHDTDSSVAETPRVEATAEAGAKEIEWAEPEPDLVDDAQPATEVARSGPSISGAARTEPESVGLIETDTDDAATEVQPATEPERARVFRTCVLLSAEWRPATVVVHASLRRAGQRNAQLIPGRESDEPVMLDVGGTLLEVVLCPAPLDQATIEFAAAQSFDWPEAEAEVAGHVAHIIFTTRALEETDRAEIVRIHHRAQAALTEFARVQAAFWPDAGRLVPADDLARLAAEVAETDSPTGTCITLRTFPPEGDTSTFVCDTVGLHGFGLPDVEIVSEDEPDEGVSAALSELSGRIFVAGCDAAEGGPVALSDGSTWLASRGNARFAPSRAVIELRRVDGSADRTTESDEGTPPENTGD